MKIVRVETIPFSIPYKKPLKFASGEVHTADHVLVLVHTDEGLTGVAEAPPRPYTYGETQESIIAVIDKIFAPQILGLSALEREAVLEKLDRTVANPTAKSALDMALWDILGKAANTPVTQLLGGYSDRMRVSHMVGFAPTDQMVAEAERVRDTYGITTFKVKVGRHPYTDDVEACRALRKALGDDVELYIDGNRGWTASESAMALRAMEGVGLTFAEELCPADDVLGRRWLVSRCPVPFVADESATRPGEVTRELLGGSATAISIKTARTGFTTSQRVLHQCEGLGVEVLMGSQIDGQIGTLCSAAFGAAHQTSTRRAGELSNFLDMSDDLLAEPLTIADGTLRTRESAGLGIEIDPKKLARYRQDT
ncbi:mandelate racemase/muconate lactonizing enzyme family protein [Streptomyces mirabilis]|uniref:mandelate racemase/muconate lactonizing enzyme family protein n=1 Tax=Streptomyces mirabilis TaxID=68239 RepID=UPI0036EA6D68